MRLTFVFNNLVAYFLSDVIVTREVSLQLRTRLACWSYSRWTAISPLYRSVSQ